MIRPERIYPEYPEHAPFDSWFYAGTRLYRLLHTMGIEKAGYFGIGCGFLSKLNEEQEKIHGSPPMKHGDIAWGVAKILVSPDLPDDEIFLASKDFKKIVWMYLDDWKEERKSWVS